MAKPKWNSYKLPPLLGLNTTAPADLTGWYSPDLANVRHIVLGQKKTGEPIPAIRSRTGYATYNDNRTAGNTARIGGLYNFRKNDGTNKLVAYGDDKRLYSVPTVAATAWQKLGFNGADQVMTNGGATTYPQFETFNNKMIYVDGTNGMQQWDGTESAAALEAVVPLSWRTMGVLSTAVGDAQAVEKNGYGYFLGGWLTGNPLLGRSLILKYDYLFDTWSTLIALSAPRGGGGGYSCSGKIIFLHGTPASNVAPVNTVEVYDEGLNVAIQKTAGGTARNCGAYATLNSKCYYIGGCTTVANDTTGTDTNCYYEPYTDSWTTGRAVMTAARTWAYAASTASIANVTMGDNTSSAATKTNYQYNETLNTWTTKTAAPAEQAGMPGVTANNSGYYVGNAFYGYNFSSDAWTTYGNPSTQQGWAAVTSIRGVFIKAGGRYQNTCYTAVESYNANPAAPSSFWIRAHGGYLFAGRTATYPSRVFFSSPGDHAIWNPFAFIDVWKDDGGVVTGIESVANGAYLAVFKDTGVFAIDGTIFDPDPSIGNMSVRKVNDKGCASGYSIVKVNDRLIIYLGIDGKVYMFDGVNSEPISEAIHTTITGFTGAMYQYAHAIFVPKYNEYWLTFKSTNMGDRILRYNLDTASWFLDTPAAAMDSLCVFKDGTTNLPVILGGGFNTGYIYRWDTNSSGTAYTDDNGTAINAYYKTAWYDLGTALYKLVRRLYLFCTQTGNWNISTDAYSDFSSTGDMATQTNNLNSTNIKERVDLNSHGSRVQFKFSNNTANQYFEIQGGEVKFIPKGGGMWTA